MTDEVGPFVLGSYSSAICRVPVEIWAEIFVFVRMIDMGPHVSTLYHPRQPPWNLSYVCSLWRQIAVSHSRLWTYSLILESECLSLKDPVTLLKLILTRSSRPRGICFFEGSGFIDNNPSPLVRSLLQVLIDHSTCWKWIRIRVHSSYADMLSQLHGKLPSLVKLYVLYDETTARTQGFEVCPRLVSLTLAGGGAFETISEFAWSQLTEFIDLRNLSEGGAPLEGEYYASIIAAAPNLHRFETDCVPLITPRTRVHHDSLKEISIADVSLLSFFSLPSLDRLTISPPTYDISTVATNQDDISMGIHTFLAESRGCSHLRILSVADTIPDANFYAVLAALPQLAELELSFFEWEEHTLSTMEEFLLSLTRYVNINVNNQAPVSHDYHLLPSLTTFGLLFNRCPGAPDPTRIVAGAAFQDMLQERYGFALQRSVFKSIYLLVSGDPIEAPKEIINNYNGLQRLGLDFLAINVVYTDASPYGIPRDILSIK